MPVACTFVCDDAKQGCGGVCKPGSAKSCNGKVVQSCQANGTLKNEQDCGTVPCTLGECKACTPKGKQCNAGKPQTCSDAGDWVDDQATPCAYLCDAATGLCAGECVPGTDACFSGTTKRCGADGKYNTGTLCPYLCDSSTGKCGGECKPTTKQCTGSTSQTCSGAGKWGMDQSCQYGCNTSTGQCNTCTDEAMTTTCGGGKCGPTLNNCGKTVQCGSTCNGTGQTCGGGGITGVCGCSPDPIATTCAGNLCGNVTNNCGTSVSCPTKCDDGKYCNGAETCVSNHCQNGTSPCTAADATNCVATCTEGASSANCAVTGKDGDGDGHKTSKCAASPGDDCDDGDNKVYTGATETCDGKDNNCNGGTDEGTTILASNSVFDVASASTPKREPAIASDGTNYGIAFENTNNFQLYMTAYNPARQVVMPTIGLANGNSNTHSLTYGGGVWGFSWFEPANGVTFVTIDSGGTPSQSVFLDNGSFGNPRVAYLGGTWGVAYMNYDIGAKISGRTYKSPTIGSQQLLVNFGSTVVNMIATSSRFVVATDGGNVTVLSSALGGGTALPGTVGAIIGAGSGGNFGLTVPSASGGTQDFYIYNATGTLVCGPVAIGDASFVPDAIAGNAGGYVVVASGSNVRVIQVTNACKPVQTWTVSASAGYSSRVAAATNGYGVAWEISDGVNSSSNRVKARIFGANVCN